MVMILKDHEKQAHGFISVTRLPRQPADLRAVVSGGPPGSASDRGGGRRSLAAAGAMGPQSPHFGLGLAALRAVALLRGRAGPGKCPPAAWCLTRPEPVGAGLGDQLGQPGDGPRRMA